MLRDGSLAKERVACRCDQTELTEAVRAVLVRVVVVASCPKTSATRASMLDVGL